MNINQIEQTIQSMQEAAQRELDRIQGLIRELEIERDQKISEPTPGVYILSDDIGKYQSLVALREFINTNFGVLNELNRLATEAGVRSSEIMESLNQEEPVVNNDRTDEEPAVDQVKGDEEPVIETPVVEAPVVDVPVPEIPSANPNDVGAPVVGDPVQDDIVIDTPKEEQKKDEEPVMDTPEVPAEEPEVPVVEPVQTAEPVDSPNLLPQDGPVFTPVDGANLVDPEEPNLGQDAPAEPEVPAVEPEVPTAEPSVDTPYYRYVKVRDDEPINYNGPQDFGPGMSDEEIKASQAKIAELPPHIPTPEPAPGQGTPSGNPDQGPDNPTQGQGQGAPAGDPAQTQGGPAGNLGQGDPAQTQGGPAQGQTPTDPSDGKKKVVGRRLHKWKNSLQKKGLLLKALLFGERVDDKSPSYVAILTQIGDFRANYKERSAEENNNKLNDIDRAITSSSELSIDERKRLYKKLSKLAKISERYKNKQFKKSTKKAKDILDDEENYTRKR